jgi:hypothetical protein
MASGDWLPDKSGQVLAFGFVILSTNASLRTQFTEVLAFCIIIVQDFLNRFFSRRFFVSIPFSKAPKFFSLKTNYLQEIL